MKNLISAIALLYLISCAHKEVTSVDFAKDKTVVVAKLNFVYSGSKIKLNDGIWNRCYFFASHETQRSMFSEIKNDYVSIIMNEDTDEVTLDGAHCSSYRVLYLKNRNYVPQSSLVFKVKPGMVNYIGDINLIWDSKPYLTNVNDYINLGTQDVFNKEYYDKGKAELKIVNKFPEAKNYIMQQFKIEASRIVNSSKDNITIKNQ